MKPQCRSPFCHCCKQGCRNCMQCANELYCKCINRRSCCGLPIPHCICPYCPYTSEIIKANYWKSEKK